MAEPNKRRVTFGCTLPSELLARLDEERGLVPRTRFLERLVEAALNGEEGPSTARGPGDCRHCDRAAGGR